MADKSIPTIQQLAGNVGIGTSSPSTKLDVIGDTFVKGVIFAYAGSVGNQVGGITWSSTDDGTLFLKASNVTKVNLNSNGVSYFNGGSVGIGTTSPNHQLAVYAGGARTATTALNAGNSNTIPAIAIQSGDSTWASSTNGFAYYYNATNGNLDLYRKDNSATENQVMTWVRASGNVGIGTTSAGYKLDVNGEIGLPGTIRLTNGGGTVTYISEAYGINLNGDTTHPIQINATLLVGYNASGGSYGTNNAYIAGNVGIGTSSPTQKLDVAGSIIAGTSTYRTTIYGAANGARITFGTPSTIDSLGQLGTYNSLFNIDSNNGPISFQFSGSEKVRITADGSVGIGTTSPAALLNVAGGLQLGNSSTSTISLRYTRTNGGVTADAHYFTATANTPNQTWIEGGYMTGELAGTITSPNSGYPYFENYAGQGSATAKAFGFVNKTSGNFTSGDLLYAFNLLRTGQIRFNQYTTSTSFTGTAAGYLAFNSSGDIITTSNGGVGGSGTTSYVARWTGTNTLGIGVLYDNGTNVGINTTSPSYTLDVVGTIRTTGSNPGFRTDNTTDYTSLAAHKSGARKWQLDTVGNSFQLYYDASSAYVLNISGSAGNVGIGTTSPAYKLDVSGNGNFTSTLSTNGGKLIFRDDSIENNLTTSDSAAIVFNYLGYATSTAYYRDVHIYNGKQGSVAFFDGSSGNVGIGTTSPARTLHVSSAGTEGTQVQINGTSDSAGIKFIPASGDNWEVQANTSNQWFVYNRTDSAYRLLIDSVGNVGIGTTSPSATLTVSKAASNYMFDLENASEPLFRLRTYNSGSANGSATPAFIYGLHYGTTENAAIRFYRGGGGTGGFLTFTTSDGTEKMRIDANGALGIGTTSPSYKTEVAGAIAQYWNGTAFTGTPLALAISNTNAGGYDPVLIFQQADSNGTVKNAGGIGLVGTAAWTAGDNTSQVSDMYFLVRNLSGGISERMRIKSNGNVGIGTTNPDKLLRVEGASIINGNLSANTTYNGFALNVGGTAYVIGGSVWVQNGYGYANSGATNTGMYPDSNHVITFKNNNSSNVTINASGSVGIGTTSPSFKLDVSGNGRFLTTSAGSLTTKIRNEVTSASGGTGYGLAIESEASAATSYALTVRNLAESTTYLHVSTATGSVGNVGIGTTSPATKLQVNGTFASNALWTDASSIAYWGNYSTAYGGLTWDAGYALVFAGGGNTLRLGANGGNTHIIINTSGNVGIGTTSPSSVLDVVGNIEYSGITKGSRGENKNFSSYDWCWHGKKYAGYISDIRTKLYEYYYTTTALTDEKYVNTYDADSNCRLSFDTDSYTAIFTSHIHVKRQFTVSSVTLNGDDPYAIWVNGEYVSGADTCCSGVTYSYTFNVGWHRIDLIFSEGGGGDYVSMGWNPKDYTDYIDAMTPFGPLDFYSNQLTMRGGNVGVGTTNPAYKLDISGTIRATGDVIAYSDARVKDNVTTVENALDKVKSLRGVTYTRKDDDTKSLKVGVIAQEVLPILPEVVQQDTNGNYSVAYGNMVGVLIEAIKEQQRQIDELKYLLQTINK